MRKSVLLLIMMSILNSIAFAQDIEHAINTTDYSKPVASRQRKANFMKKQAIPSEGSPKIPVILVQFADLSFTCDTLCGYFKEHNDENVNSLYSKFFNGNMDGTLFDGTFSRGAVRDYFSIVSDSIFTPEFSIIGPVTLSNGFATYGRDEDGVRDVGIRQFYSEACKLAVENNNIDWSLFDNNNDGEVDIVFFIYAGPGQNKKGVTTDAIWPREGSSTLSVEYNDYYVDFASYGCTNEILKNKMDGIGCCIHELSHGLGLYDHYDYNGKLFGMGHWDIMDSGNYCNTGYTPCHYTAFELNLMNWRTLEKINIGEQVTLTLRPISLDGKGYQITNPDNPDDFVIVENRQNIDYDSMVGLITNGSSYLGYSAEGKTHGLLATHVLYDEALWAKGRFNTGQESITIIPADGEKIASYGGLSKEYFTSILGDPYPGATNNHNLEIYGQQFEVIENGDYTITLLVNGGTPIIDDIHNPISANKTKIKKYIDSNGKIIISRNDIEYNILGIRFNH